MALEEAVTRSILAKVANLARSIFQVVYLALNQLTNLAHPSWVVLDNRRASTLIVMYAVETNFTRMDFAQSTINQPSASISAAKAA